VADFLPALGAVSRLCIATVFLAAAVGKVRQPSPFAETVMRYGLTTPRQAHVIARALPMCELAVGVLLAIDVIPVVAATLALVLLGGFTALMVRTTRLGQSFPCNCFGANEVNIGPALLARNIILLLLGLVALIAGRGSITGEPVETYGQLVSNWLPIGTATVFMLLVVYSVAYVDVILSRRVPHVGRRRFRAS